MWQHDRHPGSCKRRLRIATREIKRLSGRWRKRLNGEVNLLTWRGNKRRKKPPKVILYIFWGVGGCGGTREREEKERRGINPAYENTGREEGGGGGWGGWGRRARKGDVHVSVEVILAAAAEPGSRNLRVPGAAPKFPRRRGGGGKAGGRDPLAGSGGSGGGRERRGR